MNRARSCQEKKSRAASPFAKWKIDAPIIIVLSTSKKAAAEGSGATSGVTGLGVASTSCWSALVIASG